jgi:ABC-type antimicrobial peptide transport system permease subunit
MLRSKLFSFLNIVGLAFGLACTILLYLWIKDELGFNKYHENLDRIYLVNHFQNYSGEDYHVWVNPGPLAKAFKEKYPEVEISARYTRAYTGLVNYGEKKFTQNVAAGDPSLLDIYTIEFIDGTKSDFASGINTMIISETIAKQYFGQESAIGKTLMVDDKEPFIVQGVFKDFPKNINYRFDMLIPFEKLKDFGQDLDNWGNNWCLTLVLLKPEVDYLVFNQKISNYLEEVRNRPEDNPIKTTVFLNPLSRVHLYDIKGGGKIETVRIFGIIAIFILLIACFNYTNLATARAENRAKEIAVRKVLSASKSKLIIQFLGESFVFTFLAMNFSLILVRLFLPAFNNMAGKELIMNYTDITILVSILVIWIFTSFMAGLYPAFVLSSFKVVSTLKGSKGNNSRGGLFRKILVVIQFSLSIALIISTLIVNNQLDYLKNKELGLNKENMIYVPIQGKMMDRYDFIKNDLLSNPNILSMCRTSHHDPYTVGSNGGGWEWEGKDPNISPLVGLMFADYDFPNTFEIGMFDGRYFSEEFSSDTARSIFGNLNVVINKTFANIIGTEGITEKFLTRGDETRYPIIGVMDDFHFLPADQEMMPLLMINVPDFYRHIFIRISGNDISETVKYIESIFAEYNPGFVFDYGFLDDGYENLYRSEERIGDIMRAFTIFAILISCLGLFGLAAFSAQKKTKEIGIRKALGAPVANIVVMLAKEMTKWVLISNIIAWPIAYYFMNKWLTNYPYHYEITIWVFILAGAIAFGLSLLTVIYQSLIASTKNPVNSLRYE